MDLPRPLICPVPPAAAISAARARPLYKAPQARTVVIVGAGFSGTAVAIHLLRLPHSAPLRVVVVERSRQLTGSQLAIDEIAFLLGFSEAECLSSCLQALDGSFAPRLPDLGTGTQLPRRLSSAAATKQEPETSPHGEAFRLFRRAQCGGVACISPRQAAATAPACAFPSLWRGPGKAGRTPPRSSSAARSDRRSGCPPGRAGHSW